jgi:acetate kinase
MLINASVKAEIERISIYVQLHNPANLMEINIIEGYRLQVDTIEGGLVTIQTLLNLS